MTTPEDEDAVDVMAIRRRLQRAIDDNDDSKATLWAEYRQEMLIRRYMALQECGDEAGREMLRAQCARSPYFFMRTLGVVVEPRDEDDEVGTVIPFIPFPHQEEAAQYMMWAADEGETVMFPKTRDMGLTWVALHLIVWFWLFRPGFQALLGSRAEPIVDKVVGARNAQTLFGRMERIIDAIQTQAPFLLPRRFSLKNKTHRQLLFLTNPENGAQIEGQSSSPHFSRQGRYRVILLDEFDFWPDSDAVFGATQDSARARWIITTANKIGRGTAKKIIDQKKAVIQEYGWDKHPMKTLAWYKQQAEERFEDDLASEVDISWEGNRDLLIYPSWSGVPQATFPYVPGWPTYGTIDFGRGDGTGIIIVQKNPNSGRWRILGSIYQVGQTIDYFFPLMGSPVVVGVHNYPTEALEWVEKMRVWKMGGIIWYGDPAGRQLQQAATLSIIQQLQQARILVTTNPSIVRHEERQARTKVLLRNCEVDTAGNRMLDASMKNYRRPKGRDGVRPQKLAQHTWASHLATALEYLAVNATPDKSDEEREREKRARNPPRQVAAWEAV